MTSFNTKLYFVQSKSQHLFCSIFFIIIVDYMRAWYRVRGTNFKFIDVLINLRLNEWAFFIINIIIIFLFFLSSMFLFFCFEKFVKGILQPTNNYYISLNTLQRHDWTRVVANNKFLLFHSGKLGARVYSSAFGLLLLFYHISQKSRRK